MFLFLLISEIYEFLYKLNYHNAIVYMWLNCQFRNNFKLQVILKFSNGLPDPSFCVIIKKKNSACMRYTAHIRVEIELMLIQK